MQTRKPNGLFTRDSIVAILMIGVALAFLILGKHADYQVFLGSIVFSFLFLFATFFGWRQRMWLRILAYAVLLLAVFWNPQHPRDAIFGVAIVILTALIQGDQPDEGQTIEDISAIFNVKVEGGEKPQ